MPVDKPKAGETKDDYLAYCIPQEINNGMEEDQAVAVCISYYDRDKMSKHNMSYEERAGVNLNKWEARLAVINLKKEGVNLAAYPWEQCIADQTDRYGEEAAPRICGYIKSEYGS